ncbi:guanine nucleotide exchange factor subunit Rich-like [Tigriopus californicus]|uniref:guanine nucleotide exchange factor subunit Rich-like n=1 Tax=Tigriopus californicus TaxID=6832 RepID=UPI0027DA45A8|nr:guanine nucleotide exchange factor subunit Rich-like [Tigriopus californicus]
MYYPIGWPKLLKLSPPPPPDDGAQSNTPSDVEEPSTSGATSDGSDGSEGQVRQVLCNRDKILTAILLSDALHIWYVKPCVPIISHFRSSESLVELGQNKITQWRPDSSMIAVATTLGHLIIYHIVVPTDVKTLYEQVDPQGPLARQSDELFMKELIPPLIFSLAFEVVIEEGITDIVAIRDELMIATQSGKILRYSWEGEEIRDYSLDLKRIPFCVDQQVMKAVPLSEKGAYVTHISYSPLLGGFAIILMNGKAAFLVASTSAFDPNSVTGIWAPQVEDATCSALNHKYKLIAFGRQNSQAIVYSPDEMTGGLCVSHELILRTRDYPGSPGPVTCLRWTPDGTVIAMTWKFGGFALWSTFGAMIMCSLCWDYGPSVTDPVLQNPLCLSSVDWSAEGYQLWMVNQVQSDSRDSSDSQPLFEGNDKEPHTSHNVIGNRVLILPFVKSPMSVNPGMSKQEHIYLQGEDRLYLNLGRTHEFSNLNAGVQAIGNSLCTGGKYWTIISIPYAYMGSSWPIRFTALDDDCTSLAIAGRTGFAHYSVIQRKWRLFGNETQEKDFIVTGGLLWWDEFVIVGCYNLNALQDEVRAYPKNQKLDNQFATIMKMDSQVLLLNTLDDLLIVFCADNFVKIYTLQLVESTFTCQQIASLDANGVPGLTFHPACVTLIALTKLRSENTRTSTRDSLGRGESPQSISARDLIKPPKELEHTSVILNICGRVIMIQSDYLNNSSATLDGNSPSLPTVLASNCETIWFPRLTNLKKPHLTGSLWLYCGSLGMKVWLPVFPRDGRQGHNFMSRRIMLHFPMYKLYPLAILFEDAIILGAEGDSLMIHAKKMMSSSVPYSTLERTSLLFLHHILRQLIKRNLGYHAWEIARTCMNLPYFQHSLELLLHEVLEEEATSTEPIPDALLPSIVEFIQEFPVFHRTVGRCARKTEVALWPHLFAVVGSPKSLFTECLEMKDLETATTYLLILQNLEVPVIAQHHARLLLDSCLEASNWELAKEIVRFLQTIDPSDLEDSSNATRHKYHMGLHGQGLPVKKSAPEEEISLLLGTLQVPRGRPNASVTNPKSLSRSESVSVPDPKKELRRRKSSSSAFKELNGSVQDNDFHITPVLHHHAHRLFASNRLHDLASFAAHLSFPLVAWLKEESLKPRGTPVDYVQALKQIHHDFTWPLPILLQNVMKSMKRSISVGVPVSQQFPGQPLSLDSSVIRSHPEIVEENGTSSYVSTADSGFDSVGPINGHNGKEDENGSLDISNGSSSETSYKNRDKNALNGLHSVPSSSTTESEIVSLSEAYAEKGSEKSEVQLRYLLQIMMEASCFDMAALLSLVLKDVMALIRIINSIRTSKISKIWTKTILDLMRDIKAWSTKECYGYLPFFRTIQPQIQTLQIYLDPTFVPTNSPPKVDSGSSLIQSQVLSSLRKSSGDHMSANALINPNYDVSDRQAQSVDDLSRIGEVENGPAWKHGAALESDVNANPDGNCSIS